MARATLRASWGARTIDFDVETAATNEDELADAIVDEQIPGLKERVWQTFLDHYDVIDATYDMSEPPEPEERP